MANKAAAVKSWPALAAKSHLFDPRVRLVHTMVILGDDHRLLAFFRRNLKLRFLKENFESQLKSEIWDLI